MIEYSDYLCSENWKEKRKSILLKKGLFCSRCGREMQKNNLDIHHKDYGKDLGSEDIDEDLMLVCTDCHSELHQDIEFFDNPEMKNRCPECSGGLVNHKCKHCGIELNG